MSTVLVVVAAVNALPAVAVVLRHRRPRPAGGAAVAPVVERLRF